MTDLHLARDDASRPPARAYWAWSTRRMPAEGANGRSGALASDNMGLARPMGLARDSMRARGF